MKRALSRAGRFVILVALAFFVIRSAVEFATIPWRDPSSYRDDWGGPSLAGVLLVHSGPGIVARRS